LFAVQLCWYLVAAVGAGLPRRKKAAGLVFIPYYFCLMNYAMIGGMIRFLRGKQSVLWEKPARTISS
jgi:biofilm PGA synthesis N-glycosyltransferase PgaC